MSDDAPFLKRAYSLKTPADSEALYRDWAHTYETGFVADSGYALHLEVARQFALIGGFGPVLDVGAGTGLCGQALRARGIEPVDGTDISPEMLAVAEEKSVYRSLFSANILEPVIPPNGLYQGAVSSGTFTTGHVGPEGFDKLLTLVLPRAWVVVPVNAQHFGAAGFAAKLDTLVTHISDLSLKEVAIYAPNVHGQHAQDRAMLVSFRKT